MNKGISILSLIITVIVIILLAGITIFSGLKTPDHANFAKYVMQINNFQTALQDEYMKRRINYSKNNKSRTDEQIYYSIATGNEVDLNTDVSSQRESCAISDFHLDFLPNNLEGTECYLVTPEQPISKLKDNKGFFAVLGDVEKHYITNKGEFIVLPGYPYESDETTKWYVTANRYYEGNQPITGFDSISNDKKVIFHANGGTVNERIRIRNAGEVIGTLPVPTRAGYKFNGWYTSLESGNEITSSTIMGNQALNCYAQWTKAVAEVNGIAYLTLQEAIENVLPQVPTTIKIWQDTVENVIIEKNQNITVDLQNFTLYNKGDEAIGAVITNNGTLTIANGTVNSTSIKHANINNEATGVLKISNVKILALGKRQALYNNGGKVEICNDSYLSATTSSKPAISNLANGELTITSGTITSENSQAITNEASITINSGSIVSKTQQAISNSGTLTITGGNILSQNKQGINNSGMMTIGQKDDTVSIDSIMIQGSTYGITSSAKFNFFDGTIIGSTKAIDNENNLSETEEGHDLKHGVMEIDETKYRTVHLSTNQTTLVTVFQHHGDYVFDGTNTLNTEINLFDYDNIYKDFHIEFTIKNYTITNIEQATIFNAKNENDSKYSGIAFRLYGKTKQLEFSAKECKSPKTLQSFDNIDENMKIVIERKGGILTIAQNNIPRFQCDYSNFTKYFDVPVTFGSSLKTDGPFRFFTGTLSDIIMQVQE